MWSPLRSEIENARNKLCLSKSEFCAVPLNEWQQVENNIYQTFCITTHHKAKPVWLWEHFKLPAYSVLLQNNNPTLLEELIEPHETIWFFVNETLRESTKFWFYECTTKNALRILEEISINEVYFVSKKYEWLVCINHHEVLFVTGSDMPEKLKKLTTA